MKNKKSAKVLDILRTVLVCIVIAAAVFMLVFTLVTVNTVNKEDASLFGFKFFIVKSNSMKATDFAAGDIIISQVVDPKTLKEGDIITFYDPDVVGATNRDPDKDRVITHKIKRLEVIINENGEREPGFKTFGTTTGAEDSFVVPYSHILGQYRFSIPMVGNLFAPENKTTTYIIFILIPFLCLILSQGISFVRTFLKFRKEQKAILAAERAQLDEERARAMAEQQKMMEELLALKKKLAAQESAIAEDVPVETAEEPASTTESSNSEDNNA